MEGCPVDKEALSERDVCTKIIAPAMQPASWAVQRQMRDEVTFAKGRVIVRSKLYTQSQALRADLVLYKQANLPITMFASKHSSAAARQMRGRQPKARTANAVPA